MDKLFSAIIEKKKFNDHELKTSKDKIYIDGRVAGYGIALSTANILKGSDFSKVDIIMFDEFIIDKGAYHYLPREVEKFLDLIETTGRMRDIRVFMLANAITISNPYFDYFNLSLPYNSDIALFNDNMILVNYIKNEEYREAKKKTKFGRLIDGTQYGKYAIDNEFLRDNTTFVKKRPRLSKFFFIIKIDDTLFGVWLYDNKIYISKDYDPSCPIKYSFNLQSHDESTIRVRIRTSPFLKRLTMAYDESQLYFENIRIKNTFMNTFIKFLL